MNNVAATTNAYGLTRGCRRGVMSATRNRQHNTAPPLRAPSLPPSATPTPHPINPRLPQTPDTRATTLL